MGGRGVPRNTCGPEWPCFLSAPLPTHHFPAPLEMWVKPLWLDSRPSGSVASSEHGRGPDAHMTFLGTLVAQPDLSRV